MKCTLALLLIPAATAWVSPGATRIPTALHGSKSSTKQLKREKWLEGRSVAPPQSDDSAPTGTPDLERNADGLPYVTLASGDSSAQVYTLGACATSYSKGGHEYLAVRPDAKMDGSKPISGGLAFCWPQFGPGDETNNGMQQHGFARNVDWEVVEKSETSVTMKLVPGEVSKGMWDQEFECLYTVSLSDDSLDTKFVAKNTGSEAWKHQAALHSYYSVSGIADLEIGGSFKGKSYLDKMAGETKEEERDVITITEETDSVYMGVNDPIVMDKGASKKLEIVTSQGWKDCVVWNPYGNEGMGYNNFVCAESVLFENTEVAAGEEWVGEMKLVPSEL